MINIQRIFYLGKYFDRGHQNIFQIFDFDGAGKPDIPYCVRDYKKKFGGKLVNYGRYTLVLNP